MAGSNAQQEWEAAQIGSDASNVKENGGCELPRIAEYHGPMQDKSDIGTPLPSVAGTQFRLITEGADRLNALLGLIDGAQSELRLIYYIFTDDPIACRVRDALAAAAHRGVAVSLLVDQFGSKLADDVFLRPITEAGGIVGRYESKRTRRYLLRNHQKIALADRQRALIGGFNVEDVYLSEIGPESWRDLGLSITGPVAGQLAPFVDDLLEWTSEQPGKMRDLRDLLHEHSRQDGAARWLFGGPTRELSPWARSLNTDIRRARKIDIAAAYFAPYAGILRRIRAASQREGASLLTSARSDNPVTVAAARNRYNYLLPDVEIYEYGPSKLHTKLYVIDDVTYIGSANLDVRSLYLNLEVMLRIHDAEFAAAMRRYIASERGQSMEITAEYYAQTRGLWTRIKGRLAYFLMSVIDYNVSRRLNFGLDGR
jgi:cardiolipin synthase